MIAQRRPERGNRCGQRRKRSARPGQGAIESALVMLMFVFMVMGVADFAWGFMSQNAVANGVREGARRGIVRQCRETATPPALPNSIEFAAAQGMAGIAFDSSRLTVSYSGGSPASGDRVTVSYSHPYQPFTPLVGSIITGVLGMSPALSATAVMTIEGVNSSCS